MSLGTFSSVTASGRGLGTFQVASGASLKPGDLAYADTVPGYVTNIAAQQDSKGLVHQSTVIGTVVSAGVQPGTVIITTTGAGTLGWNPPGGAVNHGPWIVPPGNTIPNPAFLPQPGPQPIPYPVINGRLDTLLFAVEGNLQRMCSELTARFTRKKIRVLAAWHVIGPDLEFDGAKYVGTDKRVSIAVAREEWPDAAIAGDALVINWRVGNEREKPGQYGTAGPPVCVCRATFELDREEP